MEVKDWWKKIPKFTKYYLSGVFVITFCITYRIINPSKLALNFEKKYQVWRYLTNFLIVGKFSFNFMFFMMMSMQIYEKFEKNALKIKRYSEFIMMMIYIIIMLLLTSYFLEHSSVLSFDLLFSLLYVDCKRHPEESRAIWGALVVKNGYVPYVLTLINLLSGGDIISDIVGIAVGHLYYLLKDFLPLKIGFEILRTPEWLANYIDNTTKKVQVNFTKLNKSKSKKDEEELSKMTNFQTSFREEPTELNGNVYRPDTRDENQAWSEFQ